MQALRGAPPFFPTTTDLERTQTSAATRPNRPFSKVTSGHDVRSPFVTSGAPPADSSAPARAASTETAPPLIGASGAEASAISAHRATFATAAVVALALGASLAAPIAAAAVPASSVTQGVPAGSHLLGKPIPTQHDAAIEEAWARNGGADGVLGHPTSPIVDIGASPWKRQALMQTFEGGSIVKHQNGEHGGHAFVLSASMTDAYIEAGGAQSALGLPMGDESQAHPSYYATTSRYQEFEGGSVHTHVGGEHAGERCVVRRLFYDAYYGWGGADTWLGLPVSNDFKWNGGLRQDFEGGALFRDTTGRVTRLQYEVPPRSEM